MDGSDELAPDPNDLLVISRSPVGHGWSISFDGEAKVYFSTADDMASWIKTVLRPLDIEAGVVPAPKPDSVADDLPRIMHQNPERMIENKPARLWRVFAGGRK